MNHFSNTLLTWYSANKRDLPWRHTSDPYLIWISEIILQQTRVVQGFEYYKRFTTRFPDVASLAAASEDEVMRYWQGLGYYSRARNLHAAAKSMNGVFPTSYEGVRALKGVGEYTAAAICSFAYGMPKAVVDGNVYRVLARCFGIDTPIDSTEGKKLFAAMADELLDKQRPADYNQAIMDFGAIQCTPQSPACMFCPLAEVCVARSNGTVDSLPVKQHKTKVSNRYFHYIYVCMGDCILLRKRVGEDIWKNLFELPLIEADHSLSVEEFMAHPALLSLLADGDAPLLRPLQQGVKHVLSHRVIWTNFYQLTLPPHSNSFAGYLRVKKDDVAKYAMPRLVHAFLEKNG